MDVCQPVKFLFTTMSVQTLKESNKRYKVQTSLLNLSSMSQRGQYRHLGGLWRTSGRARSYTFKSGSLRPSWGKFASLQQSIGLDELKLASTCKNVVCNFSTANLFTTMRRDKTACPVTATALRSNNSLFQCFSQLSVAQLHASFTETGSRSIIYR